MLIAIEGIDGAGKTTAARLVCERLRENGYNAVYLDKKSVISSEPFAQSQLSRLREIIWPPAGCEPRLDPFGTRFYLYLLAAWFSALSRHIGTLGPEVIVVVDGWIYRAIVKAHIRGGLDVDWLCSLFADVQEPALVFLLDVDSTIAWTRRADFKPSETGEWDGFAAGPFTGFCAYQSTVGKHLRAFARRWNWCVVDERKTPGLEATSNLMIATINRAMDHIGHRRPHEH